MRKTKVIIAMVIIMCMIFTYVPFKVFASNDQSFEVKFEVSEGDYVITSTGDGSITVAGQFVDIKDTATNNSTGTVVVANDGKSATVTVEKPKNVTISSFTDNKFDLYVGDNYLSYDKVYSDDVTVTIKNHSEQQNNPQQGEDAPNATAKVTITGGEGGFYETHYNPATGEEEQEYIPYNQSYRDALIMIGNRGIDVPWEGELPTVFTQNDFQYFYSEDDYKDTENEGKVKVAIGSRFNNKIVGTVKINNQEFNVADYINYTDRESWLDHYDGQCVGFEVYVDKADEYNIVMNLEPTDANTCFIGNFLWTGNPDEEFEIGPDGNPIIDDRTGEPRVNDNYIGHAKLKIVKIVYERSGETRTIDFTKKEDETRFNLGERELGPGEYYQEYGDGDFEYGYLTKLNNKAVSYDAGSMVVPDGATVTMKIIPEYGYQVTSFGINGNAIITGDNISEFSFVIGKGNFHLGAEVTKVDDKVKSTIDGIKGGTITIAEGEFDSGSVMLSVAESNPTEEKTEEFNKNVPEGYEIAGYMDISLAQVFYKGSEENVWSVDKEDLNNTAKIELELEEDVPLENSVLVHNVHDGDEFETIELDYDSTTKKMSFDADSFSKYALAVKVPTEEIPTETTSEPTTEENAEETTETKASNPFTGDNIVKFVAIFAIAGLAFYVVRKNNKKVSKH